MDTLHRRVEGGRLAYFQSEATSGYWDSLWDSIMEAGHFERYSRGALDFFEAPFERHLSKKGRILEAGCGTGQYVVGLRARGYDCIGIDYAAETVQRVKAIMPDLPIMVGDITAMSFPSGSFSAVISLGVVEHRRDGPEPFLREMRRVLADDGRLLVSVPHFNSLRRLRARLGGYASDVDDLSFYQWAYSPGEFRQILADEGYRVIDEFDYNYSKCLWDDASWLHRLPRTLGKALVKGAGMVPPVRSRLGHMRLYVAVKRDTAASQVTSAKSGSSPARAQKS